MLFGVKEPSTFYGSNGLWITHPLTFHSQGMTQFSFVGDLFS